MVRLYNIMFFMEKNTKFISLIFIICLWCFSSLADASKFSLDEKQKKHIQKIEKKLNAIKTIQADFLQINDSFDESTGTLYLAKPGKLRWDYNQPNPVLIVVNNSLITYYDKELDEVSKIVDRDNIISLLAKKNISFTDNSIKLVDFKQTDNKTILVLRNADENVQGQASLIFSKSEHELLSVEIIDAVGKKTSILFDKLQKNVKIDKKLFDAPKRKNPRIIR